MGVREKIIQAQKHTKFGASLSYIDAALSIEDAWEAYYGDKEVGERLKSIKEMIPVNFWNPHAITKE